MGEGYAYRCEVCDGDADWRIERVGDVATSWACAIHLHQVLVGMKRRGEVSKFTVQASSFGAISQVEELFRPGATPRE